MKQKMCKNCGVCFNQFNTTQNLCNVCFVNKYMKPRKPIKRIGKVTQKWFETRNDWIQKNSDGSGVWKCYLCLKPLTIDTLTLDHVIPKSHRPDLRYEHDNLKACCWKCNTEKGSKH